MTVKLGTPKYEQKTKNYFAFKKDANTFILRILPPMGSLADAGKWSVFHRVEYGYTDLDGKLKPFLSPRVVNYKGMVEVESESHKRRELIKSQYEAAKKAGNKSLEEQTKKMLEKYNQDAKHYMNVVDLQGNVGLFKIGHRGFMSLKDKIDKLRNEGVDPVGIDNGRFFVFSRSGKGRDTLYTVEEYKQKTEIEQGGQKFVVDKPFPHAINDALLAKLETDAFDLLTIYPTVTPEEEYRIVHEGAAAVSEILGKKNNNNKNPASNTASSTTQAQNSTTTVETHVQQVVTQPVETVASNIVAETAVSTPEVVSAATETVVTTAASASPTQVDVSNMSEEEFFKMMEGNF
jgi:hypothetical protein